MRIPKIRKSVSWRVCRIPVQISNIRKEWRFVNRNHTVPGKKKRKIGA